MEISILSSSDELEEVSSMKEEYLRNHRDLIEIDHTHIGLLANYMENLEDDQSRWVSVPREKIKKTF